MRRVAFGGRGQQVLEHVEQLAHAGPGARRGEADRHQVPFPQRLLEGLVQLLGVDVALFEVALHELFVDLDHLVDQRAMRVGHGGEVRFAARIEETVHDLTAAAGRQVDGQAFLAEGFLDLAQQPGQVDIFRVDLVDHQQAAQPALVRPAHHSAGGQLDAGLGIDHDHGGLDRFQRAHGLAEEVGVAGRVDQMHARAAVVEVGQRGVQRVQVRFLQRVEVAHGAAALDRACRGDCPRLVQQCLGQHGLSAARMPDERERANLLRRNVTHGCPPTVVPESEPLRPV